MRGGYRDVTGCGTVSYPPFQSPEVLKTGKNRIGKPFLCQDFAQDFVWQSPEVLPKSFPLAPEGDFRFFLIAIPRIYPLRQLCPPIGRGRARVF